MTAVFAPSGNLVGCGGMDNMLTVYDINNRDASGGAKLLREFLGYEGFLSSCRFLDDKNVVTGEISICMHIWTYVSFSPRAPEPEYKYLTIGCAQWYCDQ